MKYCSQQLEFPLCHLINKIADGSSRSKEDQICKKGGVEEAYIWMGHSTKLRPGSIRRLYWPRSSTIPTSLVLIQTKQPQHMLIWLIGLEQCGLGRIGEGYCNLFVWFRNCDDQWFTQWSVGRLGELGEPSSWEVRVLSCRALLG